MAPTSKKTFEAGDLRMPLKATLEQREGEDDDSCLELLEPREALLEKEDDDEEADEEFRC